VDVTVTPFLMFQGEASQAIDLYVAAIPGGEVLEMSRDGPEGPGPEGTVMRATLSLAGQRLMVIDSPVKHAFGFTPAASLFVNCASEAELDRLVGTLGEGGQMLMAPGDHGFSRKFCWLADRFGVSWQLNLD
jgi:predicted 3-demethylubiquinone-9 3-methyltransferase (glyoxalase superfamily)